MAQPRSCGAAAPRVPRAQKRKQAAVAGLARAGVCGPAGPTRHACRTSALAAGRPRKGRGRCGRGRGWGPYRRGKPLFAPRWTRGRSTGSTGRHRAAQRPSPPAERARAAPSGEVARGRWVTRGDLSRRCAAWGCSRAHRCGGTAQCFAQRGCRTGPRALAPATDRQASHTQAIKSIGEKSTGSR